MVREELKQFFRPEFLNRVDEIIVFRQLTRGEVGQLAKIMLSDIYKRLDSTKGIGLIVTDRFEKKIAKDGYSAIYGARPLRRVITRYLEDTLAEAILSNKIKSGDTVLLDFDEYDEVRLNINGKMLKMVDLENSEEELTSIDK
jgi:ATP-dependent Clp protease ATP-binding subunit ClpC